MLFLSSLKKKFLSLSVSLLEELFIDMSGRGLLDAEIEVVAST